MKKSINLAILEFHIALSPNACAAVSFAENTDIHLRMIQMPLQAGAESLDKCTPSCDPESHLDIAHSLQHSTKLPPRHSHYTTQPPAPALVATKMIWSRPSRRSPDNTLTATLSETSSVRSVEFSKYAWIIRWSHSWIICSRVR